MNAVQHPDSGSAEAQQTLRGLVAPVILALLLMTVAVWRWDRLVASAESLVLTPVVSMIHPGESAAFWRAEIIQHWVALAAWIAAAIVVGKRIARLVRAGSTSATPAPDRPSRFSGPMAIGIVGLGLMAPLIAPIDPYAQGDLGTTRLLPPVSTGSVTVSIPGEPQVQRPPLWRALRTANRFLEYGVQAAKFPIPDHSVATTFLLGTDAVGRDVMSRLLYGTRVSVGIGICAGGGAIILGTLFGFAAGMGGRRTDTILMWIVDVFLSVPTLFLILALAYVLGGSISGIIVVLALCGWMRTARIVRGELIHLREREFVLAARLLGQSPMRIARRHLVPNLLPVLLSAALLQVSDSVLAEAALGFLGFGVQPPVPSWGNLLGDSLMHLEYAWWLALAPGVLLSAWMIALHRAADNLQMSFRG